MKILIVDDHALFRDGLCLVLQELDDQATILDASDYDRAVDLMAENPDMDLVLLDLNMPGKDGFAGLDTFSRHYPTIMVVILSSSNERSDIQRALDAGAMGYIPKESTSSVMLNALKLILAGGIYIPQIMAQQDEQIQDGLTASDLTPRQVEVLKLIVQGHSNKVIASDLNVTESTIKMHLTSIFKVLGVSNRTQAVLAAEKMKLH